ncbi:hypothetical protein HPB52_009145 [Rhipicephalus sanguineus]|uniref:Uncharacterized protein n=1 Tax=Rhipicephalus sanguineus TaxID=34632 RepID=A0A9D4QBH6_RHISA|nr:hypothetical protein HPB52_009145 [Rhipicephalus sanguineus]
MSTKPLPYQSQRLAMQRAAISMTGAAKGIPPLSAVMHRELCHRRVMFMCKQLRMHRVQRLYRRTSGGNLLAWHSHQRTLIEEAKHQPRSLAGDGRCDTPGHSADFGTYTLLDTDLNKILHIELVKSTEVASSNRMEREGLQRALHELTHLGLQIESLVTDRHSEIKAFMKQYYPAICHLFDLWHIGKGLKKKIVALGRTRQHESVLGWRKTIIRHLYWCAINSKGNEALFLARWLSILRHIVNVHSHPDPLHPSCFHGELPERDWLVEGSESFLRLRGILAAPHLLRDLPRASHKAQTFGLEGFHSLLIHFAPKSSRFTYEGILAR